MPKERNRLTDVVVKRLLGRKQPGMHPDGAGLYLRIRDGGGASWTFRYKLHGKDRWLDIGDPRDTSLARARVLARAERAKVDAGHDPIAERRAADELARKRGTFAELAEEWYAAEVEHRLKHPEAVRRALDNYLIRKLGRTPVADVKPADCARLLDDVRDKHPTTANDLLRHLKAIFAFGIRRHRVGGSPVAAFVAAKDAGGKEVSRTRALSRVELGKLFAAIRKEPTFGGDNLLLVRLLLALCVRKGELFAARWDEFDLDGKTDDGPVWHLPATRSKTGAAQDIPLSPEVVAWLRTAKELAVDSEWVFPSRRRDKRGRSEHVGRDTLNVALTRVTHGLEPFTVHDFRRTARTQLSELGVEPHVAEACLNHKPRGVEAVYNKHTYFAERRASLQAWADLLVQIDAGKSNLVPILGRRLQVEDRR
jgi:integrase